MEAHAAVVGRREHALGNSRSTKSGSPTPSPRASRRLEKGLEVIADEAVEDAAFGAAGLIAAGTHGDRTREERAGLGLGSGAALLVGRAGRWNVGP